MIYKLRNRHFRIWGLLAFLLPAGFMAAWWAIPPVVLSADSIYSRTPVHQVRDLYVDDWVSVAELRDQSNYWLEVDIKEPLSVPSLVLYLTGEQVVEPQESAILGRMDSKRPGIFDLEQAVVSGSNLVFFDPIKQVIVKRIEL